MNSDGVFRRPRGHGEGPCTVDGRLLLGYTLFVLPRGLSTLPAAVLQSQYTMSVDPGSESVGRRIRQARLAAGLTVKELAARASVSPSYLSDVERGAKNPSLPVTAALAAVLGRSLDWIVFGETRQRPEIDLRLLLRDPSARIAYGGEELDEADKERLVDLLDAALSLRRPRLAMPRPGAAPEQGGGLAYPPETPEMTAWIRRVVADAMQEYWRGPVKEARATGAGTGVAAPRRGTGTAPGPAREARAGKPAGKPQRQEPEA